MLYRRKTSLSEDEVKRIADVAGVTIIDKEVSGALLVDTTSEGAEKLRGLLPGWVVAKEVEFPPPGLHPYQAKKGDQ